MITSDLFLMALLASTLTALGFAAGYWLDQHRWRKTWVTANERLKFEAELEALRDEIWELKEEEAAKEKAEAANEAKTRFLATVSHEMRTPLNGILGMAELISQPGLSAEQTSYLEAIQTSGKALSSLIDEILDFSKIEAGKIELISESFDLVALVEGVAEILAPRAQGRGLEIATIIDSELPRYLTGDEARLRQVLINLAGNAVKFTEKGGVGLRADLRGPGLVRFEISDTGPGIPLALQATIFEEFEQADGSSSRRHEGSGLGLAISRRIVSSMGGSLKLERSGVEGSVFAFELQLPAASHQPALAQENQSAGAGFRTSGLSGCQVLIVARSPFEGPYMGERLDGAGAAVLRANSEDQAMDMLSRGARFDVVIVDCALGEDVTQRLAAAARAAGVPRSLVLFSPFERRAFGQNTMREFDGWLVKPVRTGSLLQRLTDATPQVEPDVEESSVPEPSTQTFQALIAEDNDINALIARKHLERLGAEVTHALDGVQAVEAVRACLAGERPPFTVVLMDIRMPNLDGIDATRRIRALEREFGSTPMRILALTANAFDEDRRACLDAGIDEFLTKPVDFARIAKAVMGEQDAPQSA